MNVRMDQAMLVQDELAQALGFTHVALVQAVGKQATRGFAFQRAAQCDSFITRRAEP